VRDNNKQRETRLLYEKMASVRSVIHSLVADREMINWLIFVLDIRNLPINLSLEF